MEDQPLKEGQLVPEGVQARLRTVSETLSEAERRVARFIEQYPDETMHLSVQMLAQRIGVSEATIVRCCRSLGFQGVLDLKLALASETVTPLQQIHEDIALDDTVLTI